MTKLEEIKTRIVKVKNQETKEEITVSMDDILTVF